MARFDRLGVERQDMACVDRHKPQALERRADAGRRRHACVEHAASGARITASDVAVLAVRSAGSGEFIAAIRRFLDQGRAA